MYPLNTFQAAKVAHHFTELDSTNVEALRRLRLHPLPTPGTIITADYQTAGQGQANNRWHSSAGLNLLVSIIMYPTQLRATELFSLTQLVSLATLDAVAELLPASAAAQRSIKWPNDLYLRDSKVGGLLVQNSLQGDQLHWSVIGLGLNVNENAFPPALAATATSLQAHRLGLPPLAVGTALAAWTAAFQSAYERYFLNRNLAELNRHYHERLYRINEAATYLRTADQHSFKATLRGVTDQGLLRLERSHGREETYDLKAIAFR